MQKGIHPLPHLSHNRTCTPHLEDGISGGVLDLDYRRHNKVEDEAKVGAAETVVVCVEVDTNLG